MENQLNRYFKIAFIAISAILLGIMMFVSKDYGLSGDEWIQAKYGDEIYDYFANGDTAAYSETGRVQGYDNIILYSGGYEYWASILTHTFDGVNKWRVRHAFNALFGFLIILFSALTVKKITNNWAFAALTLAVLAFSPRLFGHAMNNSKDIPFAFAYIFTVYHLITFAKNLPKIDWKNAVWVTVGIALAINMRIGGLLLIAYLGLFTGVAYLMMWFINKTHPFKIDAALFKNAGIVIAMAILGYAGGLLFWPFAHQDPLTNPMLALEEMTNFQMGIRILFDGKPMVSTMIPDTYTLKWMYLTLPEINLILLLFGLIAGAVILVKTRNIAYFILLFTGVFPLAYAIIKDSALYDGWRHFIFIYPPLMAMAIIALHYFLKEKKPIAIGVVAVIFLGLGLPARFMIVNHPNGINYFNDLNGGIKAAYSNYELDYYMNSAKQCFDQLAEKENFYTRKDTIMIASNVVKEVREYANAIDKGRIKTVYVRYESRATKKWDYGIFYSRSVNNKMLKDGNWPNETPLVTITADEVPLMVAIDNADNATYKGIQFYRKGNYQAAIPELIKAVKHAPKNDMALMYLGYCYLNMGQGAKGLPALKQAYQINDQNTGLLFNICRVLNSTGKANEAQAMLGKVIKEAKAEAEAYKAVYDKDNSNRDAGGRMMMAYQQMGQAQYNMAESYLSQGNTSAAIQSFELSANLDRQNAKKAFGQIARIYQQQGDLAKAQQYAQKAR